MRAVYVAFCHSEEDAIFRERTWGNRKDLLLEWTKYRIDIACLPQKPWIMARSGTGKAVRDVIHKFEEAGCTCDRSRSGRPPVPVETVAEAHQTMSTVRSASARSVSYVL